MIARASALARTHSRGHAMRSFCSELRFDPGGAFLRRASGCRIPGGAGMGLDLYPQSRCRHTLQSNAF